MNAMDMELTAVIGAWTVSQTNKGRFKFVGVTGASYGYTIKRNVK